MPTGRRVLFESDRAAHPGEALKARARETLRRLRGSPSAHHDNYSPAVLAALPYGSGIAPAELVELAESSGWPSTRVERLRDVEWAMSSGLPLPDRLLGATAPYYAVVAG